MKTLQLITIIAIIFFVIVAVILLNSIEPKQQHKNSNFTNSSFTNVNSSSEVIDSNEEGKIPVELQNILHSCNSTGTQQPLMMYGYSNDTHIITNGSCEWQTLEDYENKK